MVERTSRCRYLPCSTIQRQSPQLNLRRYFADLIAVVCNRFRLCPAARHLAVYLLDLFMDRYDITVQQLHMVSLSCLLLASKFEEREDRVPKLEMLNSLGCMSSMNLVLTKQGLLHMELLLLETFQWNLYLPTAAHFIEFYLSIAVHEADLHNGWPIGCLDKTKLFLAKYADYFLEVSLQDHVFLCFVPSLVAAACLASSRLILHLSPTWPPRLQRLTAYTWDDLVSCTEKLMVAHDGDVKEANKQKGSPPSHQQHQQQQQHHQQQQHQQQLAPTPNYHTSGQANPVAQYLHRPVMPYPQQTLPPAVAPSHRYLNQPIGLPAPIAPQHSHIANAATHLESKASMSNRAYQVSVKYPCVAPCFDR
ncbi:cyclin-J isoform X2 [Gadus macrocephalus]|uniref:cyclin-J isoform X2 n=1 Tax=Gadus macrocephalus TaxID=80720 RepID=UPI0028CB7D1D|nr:cyclin-J isoform X2 [Gadus macrocephalus]